MTATTGWSVADARVEAQPLRTRLRSAVVTAENVMLSLLLVAMVVLPLAEITLRALLAVGIEGATTLVRHLTLAIGTLGAAVAARDDRLLAFSGSQMIHGRSTRSAKFLSSVCSVAVCIVLIVASVRFVRIERAGGDILTYDIPAWVGQLVLPLGFSLIALRLVRHASSRVSGRVWAVLTAAAIVTAAAFAPFEPSNLIVPLLVGLLFATLLGAPVFAAVGGTALILLWGAGVPVASLAVDHYSLVSNPSLPAIPLFTLAGYLLAEGDSPRRLVDVFNALFGRLRGGGALVTVLACTFFTCFTGASGVTILALGGLVMPLLTAAGYRERSALGLVAGGGSAGVLLLPALPLILYAIVAKVSIEAMFLGGMLPALLMFVLTVGWGIGAQTSCAATVAPFQPRRALTAVWVAKWELALPLVPLLGLFSGLMTPVEAAAATAFYAFLVSVVIHRDLKPASDLPRVMAECGLMVGGILLILGVALGLTNYLVDARIPDAAAQWVTGSIERRWVFLLTLNACLLLVGCVMDIFSAIVVVAPLVVPIGLAFGVHPVHLGIIFLANLELGYLTPPVGMNLFFASYRFDKPVVEIYRAVAPLFLLLGAGVLLITYLPLLSTALPSLLQ